MPTNPPIDDHHRVGAVRERSQAYNPHTNRWIKRDHKTGQFMNQKADLHPFNRVRKEQ